VENCVVYSNSQDGIQVYPGCAFAQVAGCEVYGNGTYGINLQADDGQVTGSKVHDNGYWGICAQYPWSPGTLNRIRAEDNEVYGNSSGGIFLNMGGTTDATWVVNNQVHENGNGRQGIVVYANGAAYVEGNRVWGQQTGIQLSGGQARTNEVYGNSEGIKLYSGGQAQANEVHDNGTGITIDSGGGVAEGNRVYHNSGYGILLAPYSASATVLRNRVYANGWGIYGQGVSGYWWVAGRAENNLVYANVAGGIRLGIAGGFALQNNTVYQPVAMRYRWSPVRMT